MLFYKYAKTITITSGTWSGNTLYIHSGLLKHLLVKATSSTTVFDFTITDSDNNIILKRTNVIGKLNEMLKLPVMDICNLAISNATIDENFNIKLMVRDKN